MSGAELMRCLVEDFGCNANADVLVKIHQFMQDVEQNIFHKRLRGSPEVIEKLAAKVLTE